MAAERTVWTAQAHMDLLIAIGTNINLSDNDWQKVSQDLQVKGYNYSQNAAMYAGAFFTALDRVFPHPLSSSLHFPISISCALSSSLANTPQLPFPNKTNLFPTLATTIFHL